MANKHHKPQEIAAKPRASDTQAEQEASMSVQQAPGLNAWRHQQAASIRCSVRVTLSWPAW